MQVIGIAKLYLAMDFLQIQRRNSAFNSTAGGNIHKSGHLNRPVNRGKFPSPGRTFLFDESIHIGFLSYEFSSCFTGRDGVTYSVLYCT